MVRIMLDGVQLLVSYVSVVSIPVINWALQVKCRSHYILRISSFLLLFSFFLSGTHTFLPEGAVLGFCNFACGLEFSKNKIATFNTFVYTLFTHPNIWGELDI